MEDFCRNEAQAAKNGQTIVGEFEWVLIREPSRS